MARAIGPARVVGIVALVGTVTLGGALEFDRGGHADATVCQTSAPYNCVFLQVSSPAATAAHSGSAATRHTGPTTLLATPAAMVAQIAGVRSNEPSAPQVNSTVQQYQVDAADLGIVWDEGNGTVRIAFGDTYGNGWTAKPTGGPADTDGAEADWRCNSLASSSDHDLAHGMVISAMVEDRPGHAGQFLSCAKDPNSEITVIPTSAIHVGNTDYLAFMSVRQWQTEWSWQTNYSQIAYSTDGGRTWTKSSATWPNNGEYSDHFQMSAFAESGGYVYKFGTPNGRAGNVYLSRVAPGSILDPRAYQYWTGTGWAAGSDTLAVPVVAGPVGELSVEYDASVGKWLMTSMDQSLGAITLRTADSPAGPWSAEQILVRAADYPGLYGGFIHPWSSGNALYITVSMWGPYEVYLMRSTLTLS
jgi:D-arabinan endo alpha-(1,5)-arabinofuranosidase